MRHHPVRTAALVLLAAVLVACSPSTSQNGDTSGMDPLAELQALPTSEDIVTTYTRMEAEIRDAVIAISPQLHWAQVDPPSVAGCEDRYNGLGGRTVGLPLWSAPQPIADADWPATLIAVETIVARYGFGTALMKVDKPGNHQANFPDPVSGAYVDLGTKVASILGTNTGCHLPAGSSTAG